MTADEVSGELIVSTSNGDVEAEGCGGQVSCESSNGSILVRLGAKSAGPVKADTSNGDVTLVAGPGFRGRLMMRTSNGEVRVGERSGARLLSMSRGQAELAYGDAASESAESSLRTSNGDAEIRVEKP